MVEVSDEFRRAFMAFNPVAGAPPETEVGALQARGWTYMDFPKMEVPVWEALKAACGPENFKVLAEAHYSRGAAHAELQAGTAKKPSLDRARGQLLLSPEGRDRVLAYLRGVEAERAATAP